jgi:8-oxo-dGTP pyrophosphatase MutT (NUDIX family)
MMNLEGFLTSIDTSSVPRPGDQVAAVCYRKGAEGVEYCLVKTSSGRRIFPKGKVEKGENPWDSAAREAKEEAGVLGDVRRDALTTFWLERPKRGTRELVTAYLLEVVVDKVLREEGRKPKWWTLDKAVEKLSKKKNSANAEELERVLREAQSAIDDSLGQAGFRTNST